MGLLKYLYKLLHLHVSTTEVDNQQPAMSESHMAIRLTSKGMLCFYHCTMSRADAMNACWEAVKKDSLKVALSNVVDPYLTRVIIPSENEALQCTTKFEGLNRTISGECGFAQHRGTMWIWGKESDVMQQIEKRLVNQPI